MADMDKGRIGIFLQGPEFPCHGCPEILVERGQWFVEKHEFRFCRKCPAQCNPLFFSAAEIKRHPVFKVLELEFCYGVCNDLFYLFFRQASGLEPECNVLFHIQIGKQGIVLRYIGNIAFFGIQRGNVFVIHQDLAFILVIDTDDILDQYGLAGLKVTVPVFTGGETTAKYRQAVRDRENAALALERARENLLLELRNAVSEYHYYLETLKANNRAVDLAGQSFKLTQDLFETGQVTLTDLNDAELQLTGEKLGKVMTLYNINRTLAKIEQLTLVKAES